MARHSLQCKSVELVHHSKDGGQRILFPLSCTFSGGNPALVTGDTGAGKSSLLHILGALQRPSAGEVMADGTVISRLLAPHRDRWRRQAGLVFQHSLLLQDLSVLENVMLPLVNRGGTIDAMREKALEMLDLLSMAKSPGRTARLLSGGEAQRVAIARALVAEPHFLFLDEPTAHQDMDGVNIVLHCLEQVGKRQGVVVAASHDPRLIHTRFFTHTYHLQDGRLGKLE